MHYIKYYIIEDVLRRWVKLVYTMHKLSNREINDNETAKTCWSRVTSIGLLYENKIVLQRQE